MSCFNDIDIQTGIPVFVVERSPNNEWKLDGMVNSHYVIAYAISGEAFYRFGDKNHTVSKGNIVFVRRGEIYSARSSQDDPWSFFSVGFPINACDEDSSEMLKQLPNIFKCSNSLKMSENFSELNRIWAMRGKGYKVKCRSLLLDIFYIILGDEDRRNIHSAHYKNINQIIDFMRENYIESYSVDFLCEMSGLSNSHFRTLFKQMTGLTTVQFQNRMKIDKAKDLIISHSCNITEAAETVGFSDVYYFSRMFKKLTGKNPSEYLLD